MTLQQEFDTLADRLESVRGWLPMQQAFTLYAAARALPASAVVVEIGSFAGRSAVVFASALEHVPGGTLYCVDPFNCAGGEIYGTDGKALLAEFWVNVKTVPGGEQRVTVLPHYSHTARAKFTLPSIDLLFIDGDHSYGAVLDDLRMWAPALRPGGVLAMHDVNEVGPSRAASEYVYNDNWSEPLIIQGQLLITRKKA